MQTLLSANHSVYYLSYFINNYMILVNIQTDHFVIVNYIVI